MYGFTAYDKNTIYNKIVERAPLKGRILDETYGRNASGGLARDNNGHWCFFTENQPDDFVFDFSGITCNGIELVIYEVESVEAELLNLLHKEFKLKKLETKSEMKKSAKLHRDKFKRRKMRLKRLKKLSLRKKNKQKKPKKTLLPS